MVRTVFFLLFALTTHVSQVPAAAIWGFSNPIAGHSQAYNEGRTALRKRDWASAISSFERVIQAEEDDADGAFYWKAYALGKLNRNGEALTVIDSLVTRFPESTWSRDGRALRGEITGERGLSPGEASDDELKMMALSSLMLRPRAEAVPELKRFLEGNHSSELKEKALFVLSQRGGPEARELISEIARGTRYPELRETAIKNLGIFRDPASLKILDLVYAESQDTEIKEAIIHSWMIAGARDPLRSVIEKETNANSRVAALRALGMVAGQKELEDLYASETKPERKTEILEAMAPNVNKRSFFVEVFHKGRQEDREIALRYLGFSGGCEQLVELYEGQEKVEVKLQILHGMMVAACDHLQEVFHNETNLELREEALNAIIIRTRQPIAFLLEVYRDEASRVLKIQALKGLFIKGAAKELVEIARTETNRELRLEAVRKLSLMKQEEARAYMRELLEQ